MAQAQAAPARARNLSLATMLAFSCTSLPTAALGVAIAVHLPAFFAAEIGVPLAVVGSAFALVRMIDIPIEPGLGLVMDRTRSRFGRYRLWTVLGAPILMAGLFMLFQAPQGVDLNYLIAWLLVMYLGLSILTLSHAAWAATLATSYDARARIFGVMSAVGVLGALMVILIPIGMEQAGYSDAEGVRAMGWFVIALIPIAVALVVWRTPEWIAPEAHGQKFRARDYWELISRPSMARILAADFCLSLGPGWMSALYIFFFKDSRGFSTTEANVLLLVYILAGLAGAPSMGWLATRISKHRATMVATTGYSLCLMSIVLLPKGNVLAAIPMMFLAGFLAAGFNVLTRAMTADVADEVRLDQGKERSGLLYALTTLTSKIATAGSIFLTFTVLAQVGYDPKAGAGNTAEAIHGLELAYLIGPIVFVMLGGACFIGYRLSAARAAEIRRQLEIRDAAYDEEPIIEVVTGEAAIPSPLVEPKSV